MTPPTRRASDSQEHENPYEKARKVDTIGGIIMSLAGAVIAIVPLAADVVNVWLVILGVITLGIGAGRIEPSVLSAFLKK